MTEHQKKICEMLCKIGREEIRKWFKLDSCVASTRLAVAVLRQLRVNADPLAVWLEVFNPAYMKQLDAVGHHPQTVEEGREWEKLGCKSVCIRNNELAHVIAVAENEMIIDLSLDQTARPEKGIYTEPSTFLLPPNWETRGDLWYGEPTHGCSIVITPQPQNKTYLTSRDWNIKDRTKPAIKETLRRMRKLL